ncbi:hypothetical protein [Thalassovita sp.]|uniref:hypothetical protein n=1 Tax=Thalassovita sp. TaxID=1979401 RepID=UPI002881E7C7|nr:hypothetical protein [Thalassovita sp.]MDF1803211.1 hypothetical protein [Thalassovita sp.]
MSTLNHKFNEIAACRSAKKADEKSYPPPFSIRFTFEERAKLDAARGRKALAAHIREKLFGDDVTPRKRPGNSPVQDAEALGRVLGALGASRLSSNLNQLAKAVNTGSLPVTPETEADMVAACKEVIALRNDLLRALGKLPGPSP